MYGSGTAKIDTNILKVTEFAGITGSLLAFTIINYYLHSKVF
jgi:hypothetical protein